MPRIPNTQALSVRQASGQLPPRLRVLYISGQQRIGGWLAEALISESQSDVLLEEAVGAAAGMARLRDEVFDVVLAGHEANRLDAVSLIAGIRAGGSDEPVVVLGIEAENELLGECFAAGADAYLCAKSTSDSTFIWTVAKAVQRTSLTRDHRRLVESERQRASQEHQEADQLLQQQRTVVNDLEAVLTQATGEHLPRGGGPDAADSACHLTRANSIAIDLARDVPLPPNLLKHYRELLRAYVIMGSGNLAAEMSGLTELLAAAGISARQAMNLHLHVLEELVRGLGSRSTRHVMTRADLLALEVMVHLAEGYRQRYQHRISPPRQQALPGFDDPAPGVAA